jgi:assimilatory nitrate reductase catalytic subunit
VSALINLALACGHAGTRGSGISLVSPLPNGQGLRDWGQGGDRLPGGRSLDDPFHRSVLSRRWGFDAGQIPTPGADYEGIVALAAAGRIRGLLTMGTAPGPDGDGPGTDTLAAIEHFVAIEPHLSEVSARHARVILPGTTVLEEEGTTTTIEGRIVRSDQEVPPAANYSEFDIIRNLSRRLGVRQHFDFVRGREVFEEMRRVSVGAPGDHFGITWDRAGDGVFWPCPTEEHPGTPRLFLDRFAHPDGRARFRLVSSRNRQTSGAGPDPCEAGVSPRTWPGSGATPRTTG